MAKRKDALAGFMVSRCFTRLGNKSKWVAALCLATLVLAGCAHPLTKRIKLPPGYPPDFKEMNEGNPGMKNDITRDLAYGRYTIVDFSSPFCGPCKEMEPLLQQLAVSRRDVAVRVYDINRPGVLGIDFDSPLCKQYNVHSVPNLRIYGPNRKLLVEGREAFEQVHEVLRAEVEE